MSADSLPFMSFAVSDWIADTQDLDLDQYAILHRLSCQAWRRSGRLPNDTAALARMAGVSAVEFNAVWPAIQRWFERLADESAIVMPQLEAERLRALDLKKRKSDGAAKTNKKRWGNRSLSDSDSDSECDSLSDSHNGRTASRTAYRPSPSPSPSPEPSLSDIEQDSSVAGLVIPSKSTVGPARPASRRGRN